MPAGRPFWRSRRFVSDSAELREHITHGRNRMLHPSVIFRRGAYERSGGYREPAAGTFEDSDLWWRLIHEGEFANLPEVLMLYRRHHAAVSVGRGHRRLTKDIRASRHAGWARIALRDGYRAAARQNAVASLRIEPWSLPTAWLLARTLLPRRTRP